MFRHRSLLPALGAVVCMITLSSCGSTDEPQATADDQATQEVIVDPCINWGRGYFTAPDSEWAATPEEAVRATAGDEVDLGDTTRKSQKIVVVAVTKGDDVGSYDVLKRKDRWVVIGGDGCAGQGGAPERGERPSCGPSPTEDGYYSEICRIEP